LRTKNGRSFAFSPEWYPDLVKMCNASLDMLGFGPEMVLALATDVYATKMLIDDKDAPMLHPPPTWTVVTGMVCLHHSWHNKLHDICLHTISVEFLINVCLPSCRPPDTRRERSPGISLRRVNRPHRHVLSSVWDHLFPLTELLSLNSFPWQWTPGIINWHCQYI
jgi:hypothetical protein